MIDELLDAILARDCTVGEATAILVHEISPEFVHATATRMASRAAAPEDRMAILSRGFTAAAVADAQKSSRAGDPMHAAAGFHKAARMSIASAGVPFTSPTALRQRDKEHAFGTTVALKGMSKEIAKDAWQRGAVRGFKPVVR